MENELLVTPEELQRTATSFSTRGKSIAATTDSMMKLVENLTSVWEGDASGAYIKTFQGLQDDILKINNKIQEHASDLNEIAENYIRAENQTAETNSALPNNPLD